jgi:hypothetical protein
MSTRCMLLMGIASEGRRGRLPITFMKLEGIVDSRLTLPLTAVSDWSKQLTRKHPELTDE